MKHSFQRNKPMPAQHAKRPFSLGKVFSLILLVGFVVVGILVGLTWQMLQSTDPNQGTTSSTDSSSLSASSVFYNRLQPAPQPNQLTLTPDPNPEAEDIKTYESNRSRAQAATAAAPSASDPNEGGVTIAPMTPIVPIGGTTLQPTNSEQHKTHTNNHSDEIRPITPAKPIENNPIDNLY